MQDGRRVFLALKNGAFHCKLATRTVSMQSCPVVATLFYDDMEREVVTAKTAPLVTKAVVAPDGKSSTVECRVKASLVLLRASVVLLLLVVFPG